METGRLNGCRYPAGDENDEAGRMRSACRIQTSELRVQSSEFRPSSELGIGKGPLTRKIDYAELG